MPPSSPTGATPGLGQQIKLNLDVDDDLLDKAHVNAVIIKRVLSQTFVFPLDQTIDFLETSAFLGPLRIVPDESFQKNSHLEQRDWFDGAADWSLLYQRPLD